MEQREIGIMGASGTTGRRVARMMRERGVPHRAISRSGDVHFDWDDPSTWEPALRGISSLYLMTPHGMPLPPDIFDVVRTASIEHVVMLSSMGIETMGDKRLMDAESFLIGAGVSWTILRASWFDQNFDEGFLCDAVMQGRVTMPMRDVRQPFVDAEDIARVAVTSLIEDGHDNRRYDVTGPTSISFGDAVAMIATATGRPVTYDGSDEAYIEAMTGLGMDRDQVMDDLQGFLALVAEGDAEPTDVVQHVCGRRATSFEEYVARAAGSGAWSRPSS